MSTNLKGNAVIGQSGGPTAVINQSLVVVIQEAKKASHILDLLGARHAVRGIVNQDFLPLEKYPDELLERIAQTPASALGSTRDKPDQAYCERIFQAFAKNNVRYFFYIGGNDSADTARISFTFPKPRSPRKNSWPTSIVFTPSSGAASSPSAKVFTRPTASSGPKRWRKTWKR